LLGLAQRENDFPMLALAHWALGSTFFHLGELGVAQTHLEQSRTLYEALPPNAPRSLYSGVEPGVFGCSYAAFVLWHRGYPDQARQKSEAALTLAQKLSYPYSLGAAQVFAARLYQLRRDRAVTQEWAKLTIILAREHGFPVWANQGIIQQGWALADQGESTEGILQICQGLATREMMGAKLFQSYYLALLAEAHGKAGQADKGLSVLAEAVAVIDTIGERFYEAELYRLKGELMLRHASREQGAGSKEQEAEECFRKAIAIAQKQQAKSLELRAVMSLVRLRQHEAQDHATRTTQHATRVRLDEAHEMLAKIYSWFTEGFDTKDLQEAKMLIEELSHRAIEPLKA
jgi:predicted ATPase